ncbi:Hypothetical predicted protein [Pelobates cultripes]|uniref:Uncharacterized protein n=1 Tax=Pelobates cultripes TaxID=61616 RepID=A0AAD1RBS5_PELCU|nr:Hypothetical predicted protein [Pelobates cultripes]
MMERERFNPSINEKESRHYHQQHSYTRSRNYPRNQERNMERKSGRSPRYTIERNNYNYQHRQSPSPNRVQFETKHRRYEGRRNYPSPIGKKTLREKRETPRKSPKSTPLVESHINLTQKRDFLGDFLEKREETRTALKKSWRERGDQPRSPILRKRQRREEDREEINQI